MQRRGDPKASSRAVLDDPCYWSTPGLGCYTSSHSVSSDQLGEHTEALCLTLHDVLDLPLPP